MRSKLTVCTPMLVLFSLVAQAHVGVQPRVSVAGEMQKYTIRVPNEKNVANNRIEAEFPQNVEILSLEEKPGWKIEAKKDSAGKITGAVWSGSGLGPRDIGEFSVSARNPKEETKLVWKVVQIYEDGSRSEWTGPQGGRGPAPVTQVKAK